MVRWAALALCIGACGGPPRTAPAPATLDEVTLYRDHALVTQRLEVEVPPADTASVTIKVAAGIGPDDVVILDRGELVVSGLGVAGAAPEAPRTQPSEVAEDPVEPDVDPLDPPAGASRPPTELALVLAAPHAGRFTLALGYVTDRIAWDAAYTMTTDAARDRAVLRGAAAIRNTTGIALHAQAHIVDGELGAWRARAADQLGGELGGAASPPHDAAPPRDLGIVTLGDGETRVALLAGDPPRRMRSVLVYDPIGTQLDHPGASPVADPSLGVWPAAPARITESFEVDRDERATRGLPAGPVRLLERRPDGALAVLGEAPLFDTATRVAQVDTVAVGTAAGVTGHRERRGWAKDDDRRRFSEEFLVTIDNARPRPVEVVVREHLYRGQNWTLAYQSAPAVKEGSQQISLRTTVPANGQAKVLYVVVYTW
jgi:hypothetical protein